MTGKEVVSLINKLQAEGIDNDKIIEIIKHVALTGLNTSDNKQEQQ